VVFSPDGTRLASCSYDQKVRVWDVTSTTELVCHDTQPYYNRIEFNDDNTKISVNGKAMPIPTRTPVGGAIAVSFNQPPKSPSTMLGIDGDWVTWLSEKILWLPPEFRPGTWASHGGTLVIGSGGGRVTLVSRGSTGSPL
jgi:hypothetical protein